MEKHVQMKGMAALSIITAAMFDKSSGALGEKLVVIQRAWLRGQQVEHLAAWKLCWRVQVFPAFARGLVHSPLNLSSIVMSVGFSALKWQLELNTLLSRNWLRPEQNAFELCCVWTMSTSSLPKRA